MKKTTLFTIFILFSMLLTSCAGSNSSEQTTAASTEAEQTSGQTEALTSETVIDETGNTEASDSKSGSEQLAEILRSGQTLTSKSKLLFTISNPTSKNDSSLTLKNRQGGTFDGRYFYQAFMVKSGSNEEANIARIVKYDPKTKTTVAISDDLSTNHSNDITYIPSSNQLYVVHNNPNRRTVSVIDADTLAFIETKTLPMDIYCMNYEPTKNLFVVGLSGGQNFRFLTESLTFSGKANQSTPSTEGYTTQGCASDENFVYFVLYNQNCITVYDWKGKYVTRINFSVGSIEPENISVYDGKIYVTCANNGAAIYEITPIAAE